MDDITPEQVMRNPQALGSSFIYSCERTAKEHADPEFGSALLEVASHLESFVVYEYSGDIFSGFAFENWRPVVRLEPVPGAPADEWTVADGDLDAHQVTLYLTAEGPSVELS